MRPELPFLAAGGVTLIGGAVANHKWPSNSTRIVIGTVTLVVIASATGDTKIGPLVHAVGLLTLLAAAMATTKTIQAAKKGK